ncbi:hypothetical protein PAPYR_8624 [Paratrimastix pyriformis]|uniref:Uncharacterized protein n=1 Tax=Paratrimastix pyriformis TaxID=342808 RepID=A0ABQ8UAB5_9EUKA|nr:hypothetical protein PAPYR_8624 [Paratrimastix pyriformis]
MDPQAQRVAGAQLERYQQSLQRQEELLRQQRERDEAELRQRQETLKMATFEVLPPVSQVEASLAQAAARDSLQTHLEGAIGTLLSRSSDITAVMSFSPDSDHPKLPPMARFFSLSTPCSPLNECPEGFSRNISENVINPNEMEAATELTRRNQELLQREMERQGAFDRQAAAIQADLVQEANDYTRALAELKATAEKRALENQKRPNDLLQQATSELNKFEATLAPLLEKAARYAQELKESHFVRSGPLMARLSCRSAQVYVARIDEFTDELLSDLLELTQPQPAMVASRPLDFQPAPLPSFSPLPPPLQLQDQPPKQQQQQQQQQNFEPHPPPPLAFLQTEPPPPLPPHPEVPLAAATRFCPEDSFLQGGEGLPDGPLLDEDVVTRLLQGSEAYHSYSTERRRLIFGDQDPVETSKRLSDALLQDCLHTELDAVLGACDSIVERLVSAELAVPPPPRPLPSATC